MNQTQRDLEIIYNAMTREDVAAIDQLLHEATGLHAAIREIDAKIAAILSLGCPF